MASKSKSGGSRKSEEMFLLMKEFESSGQSQRLFWEAQGLARSTFQYWWRRYRQWEQDPPSVQGGFVPLEVRPARGSTSLAGIVITYSDGTRVEIATPVEASFIRQLVER